LSAHAFAGAFTARSESAHDTMVLTIPIGTGGGECTYGSTVVTHAPNREGGLSSGDEIVKLRTSDGYSTTSVHIPGPVMRAALRALEGSEPPRPLRFAPRLDLRAASMQPLLRTIRRSFHEANADRDLAASGVGARLAEALLFDLLVTLPRVDQGAEARTHHATPREVRRALAYIEARSSEPIRMSEVAQAAGTSVRMLQYGFRAHRGYTPTEFLRSLRLAAARRRLLSGEAASITEVALESGFSHFGRFSGLYRSVFGESPSTTRKRARAR
jgi:AraC-like DNA-binding protein